MKNFKLSLLPLILMICAQMPAGDLLSEMQTKLDRMEGIYWTAIKMDRKEASYENCRRDLQEMRTIASQIQKILNINQIKEYNCMPEINQLQLIYENTSKQALNSFKHEFKMTNFAEYNREYRSRHRSADNKTEYNLTNVDLDDYESWLMSKSNDNIGKVRGTSKTSNNDRENMQEKISGYYEAVKNLRVNLASLKQKYGNLFK